MFKSQNGNALFLILIAVALFAALSYAVTQSGRAGGNIDREQQMIDTAVAQQCSAYVEHGEQVLRMFNGCDTSELSYELPSGANENGDAPSDKSCHLFAPEGAGLNPCGGYLDILGPDIEVGSIEYGDTETAALLPNGLYFRCNNFDGQGAAQGDCGSWSYSLDGETFHSSDICWAKTSDEWDDRTYDAVNEFGEMACTASCGGYGFTQDRFNISPSYYYGPDMSVVAYTGSCYSGIDTNLLSCNCWSSD